MKRVLIAVSILCFTFSTYISAETKVGAIFDLTGVLNIYGTQQNNGLQLAIEQINEEGGLLGEPVQVVTYDAQSELNKYTQFVNTAILRDKVDVIFAGATSSSREAIRPIVRRANIPYFYSSLYEGGACDKQTFVTGTSSSQQMSVLIDWAIKEYGPKIYVMAPDYNFGTISSHWVSEFAKSHGAEVVGQDFLPLTVTDYAPTIQKIQSLKPDFVMALPVGTNQTGFLEQFAAAGLKESIGIVSTNYGSGNQQVVVSPSTGKGIVSSQGYFQEVDSEQNKRFVEAWQAKYGAEPPIVSGAVDVWNAVNLWAAAVRQANSTETKAVIAALESGISIDAPNGRVSLSPGSHHLNQNIYIAQGNENHGFNIIQTFENVAPVYENEKCDLLKNPRLVNHFTPES